MTNEKRIALDRKLGMFCIDRIGLFELLEDGSLHPHGSGYLIAKFGRHMEG